MNRNTYIFAIVATLILLGVGIYQFKNREKADINSPLSGEENSSASLESDSVEAVAKDLDSLDVSDADFQEIDAGLNDIGGTEAGTSQTITYTDKGYEPANITIKAGETVTFKNESANKTWPASAVHPTHSVYPTKGGCLGSTFDACKGLAKGESWSFKFDSKGAWKYHDHLNPKANGTITVQ